MTLIRMNGGPEDGRVIAAFGTPEPEIVFASMDPQLNEFLSEQAGHELPLTTVTYLQAYVQPNGSIEYVWEGLIQR